jgi:hypothetical protein
VRDEPQALPLDQHIVAGREFVSDRVQPRGRFLPGQSVVLSFSSISFTSASDPGRQGASLPDLTAAWACFVPIVDQLSTEPAGERAGEAATGASCHLCHARRRSFVSITAQILVAGMDGSLP